MKIGLSAAAFPANMSIPQGLRLAKRSGFDCVELDISEAGYLTPDSSEQAVGFLRQAVENMSLYVGSVRASVFENCPMATADENVLQIARRCLEIGSQLGAHTLCMPLGQFDGALTAKLPDSLKTLCPSSQDCDVSIALECATHGLVMSAREAAALVDSVACEWVGVCVDTGNAGAVGTPSEWIAELGSRVKMVRARDYQIVCNGFIVPANLLQSDIIKWREVRRALIDTGYRGVIIAKIPGYSEYAELGVKHCGESMKRIFGSAVTKQE